MALQAREDGRADDWREERDRWFRRGSISAADRRAAAVSRPLADPVAVVAPVDNLAAHYSRFRVTERLLLTGHSHQAWPDVGFAAQQQAWLDAAEFVDAKWERATQQASLVQAGFRRLLNDADGDIALGQNTHE